MPLLFVDIIRLIVLGFNDTSTLVGHFVSSSRKKEKRNRRDSRRDESDGQGRKRTGMNVKKKKKQTRNKTFPYLLQG